MKRTSLFFSLFLLKTMKNFQHFIPRQLWPPDLSPRTHRAHLQKKKSTSNTRTQIRLGTRFSDELVRNTTETGHYHILLRTTETRVWETDPVPTKCNRSYTRNSSSKTQDRRHLIVQNEIFSVQDKGRVEGVGDVHRVTVTYTDTRAYTRTHKPTSQRITTQKTHSHKHIAYMGGKRGSMRASFRSGPLGRRMMESTHFLFWN